MRGPLERSLAPLDELVRAASGKPRLARFFPARAWRSVREWRRELGPIEGASDATLFLETFLCLLTGAVDTLAFALRRSADEGLAAAFDAARSALAAAGEAVGIRFLPGAGEAWTRERLEAAARETGLDVVAIESVPSREPAGAIVAVERRAIVAQGELVIEGRVQASSGEGFGPRGELLLAALAALEASDAGSREDHARLSREVDRAARTDPGADAEAALRFACGALERAQAIPEARRAVVAFLQEQGLAPIALAPGERFDPDRHPASAFERCGVLGERGVVVATAETGFRDAGGVVLSRAIVLVGTG